MAEDGGRGNQLRSNFHWSIQHGLHNINLATTSSQRIRDDIQQVIRELSPLVERSPLGPGSGQNWSSWFNQSQEQTSELSSPYSTPLNSSENSPEISVLSENGNFMINIEGERHRNNAPPQTSVNLSTPDFSNNSRSNNESDPTSANNNNNTIDATGDALRNNPGVRSLISFVEKYIPFASILLLKLVFDHRIGLLVIIGLFLTFCHANTVVKREVGKQSKRQITSLLTVAANLILCITFVYFVLVEDNLAYALIFIPPYTAPISIWEVLWIVTVTDFVLKLITVLFKVVIVMLPARIIPFQRKGKHYLFTETSSQLYRCITPMQHWLYFFSEFYHGSSKVFGVILSAAYLVSKCKDIVRKTQQLKKNLIGLLQSVSYGVQPSAEQLKLSSDSCPICQDDYKTPTMLQCKHIFCEECVSLWFDRERTCPMCRAQIADDPTWKDGSTTFMIQMF